MADSPTMHVTAGSLGVANIDGAIAAANSLISRQGYGIKDYPSNMGGLISAINALDIAQSNIGITPPQWMPVYDENGNITGDSWDPAPTNGTLWFDTRQGQLMVWVNDGFYQANGGDGITAVSASPPENPVTGQTWFDSDINSFYVWNGIQWTEVSGGEGSFSALSSEITLLRNNIDELSVRRSTAREYTVSNIHSSPQANAAGQLGITSTQSSAITRIAVAAEDKNGMISSPGTVDDVIDLEAASGAISRYTISAIQPDYYEVSLVEGTQDFTDSQILKLFIYPQNSDYATIAYTNEQLAILQTQLDAKHQFFYDFTEPDSAIVNDGDLWYDRNLMRLLIRDQSSWVNPDRVGEQPDNQIYYQSTAPTGEEINNGDLWFDTTISKLFIMHESVWTNPNQSAGNEGNNIYYQDTEPTGVGLNNGDIWFDSYSLKLLVRHEDYWVNPDRQAEDTDKLIFEAAVNSSNYEDFKNYVIANF